METPEFLLWSLEFRCPIRGFEDGSDPERTERQLRAARECGNARREGRVFEGLCVDRDDGFRIDDALAVYGGLPAVERACRGCPANALAGADPAALAGCYGFVPLPDDPRGVFEAIDRTFATVSRQQPWTQPRWYGIWLNSPLWGELLLDTLLVLQAARIEDPVCRTSIAELLAGLNTAYDADCRLHVQLFPRGRVEGTWWRLVPHCPRCKAAWPTQCSRQCAVCGYEGHPADEKKRRARGRRPYFPLQRLLGGPQAADFLVRYAAYRKQPESPDRPQSSPPPKPPDSLPAD